MTEADPSQTARPFDYLIVGAGFAGSVLAERLASVVDEEVRQLIEAAELTGCRRSASAAGSSTSVSSSGRRAAVMRRAPWGRRSHAGR